MNADELARMRHAGDNTDNGPYSDELDGGESFQVSQDLMLVMQDD